MAVREAAERLCVHPNTVSYRLEKIHRLVGRDPTRFSDLHEIVTWTRLLRGRDTRFGEAHNAIANYRQSVSS
jgi:DNA-binding PucR family transcriptional regulator